MDMPGLSIFQGGGSIKLDTSINRAEEEEALEDQRRRNEELGDQLQNAFDDLIEEDEYSVDLSADIPSQYANQNHQPRDNTKRSNNETEKRFLYNNLLEKNAQENIDEHKQCRFEAEKLRKNVESKTREVENLAKLLHDEKKRNEDLKKRLSLSEAEKERAQMKATQTHELLIESKAMISELEADIKKHDMNIEGLQNKNKELLAELECTKLQLSDVQHKYRIVEKNASHSADKRAETMVKEANDRHVAQIGVLQQQIDNLKEKLAVKDREYSSLDVRYKELQKNRESLLTEKSELMTQLARSMEESQKHYQELVSKKTVGQENERMQRFVHQLENQIETMQKTITDLRSRLDAASADLNLMEDLLEENTENSQNVRRRRRSQDSLSITVNDRIIRLKDELYRCLTSQREKREEIRKLRDEVNKQSEEINKLRLSENKALIQTTTANEENSRLNNKLRMLEIELNELKNASKQGDSLADDLLQKLARMKDENKTVSDELEKVRNECDTIRRKNFDLQTEVENLLQQLESKKESDQLIITLKEKARQFEEYIKNESISKRSSGSSTKFQDRGVSTFPDLESESFDNNIRHKIESNVRNDMAKVFATKIKQIEEKFYETCSEMEAQNAQLKKDIHAIYKELQTREKEVDILKTAILKEREKMHEILDSKSMQLSEVNTILERCRDELKLKQKHIEQLQQELEERTILIESERRSMKAVMSQWTEQQKDFERANKEMKEKMDAIQSRYTAAKKTAANYKRYAEDKEKHMFREYDRLKNGYEEQLKKILEDLKRKYEKPTADTRQKIAEGKISKSQSNVPKPVPGL